jgi:hypothetical protein
MIDPFITFVIHAESLDDPQLQLSLQSIRQQFDICWELKIEVPVLPDRVTIDTFTHCNPRISISQRFGRGKDGLNSTAIAFIPRGLELLPNACSELKKAFANQSVDIVSAKVIQILAEEPELLGTTRIIPCIIAMRMRSSSEFCPLNCEIDIPIGVIRSDNFAAIHVERSKSPISVVDNQIRAEHLAHLEREILVLQTQLQSSMQKSIEFDVLTINLNKTNHLLVSAESEIRAMKKSRTWRIGRAILGPVRLLKKLKL